MSNTLNTYNAVFRKTFGLSEEQLSQLEYKVYPEWNSMAHLALISALEEELDINFEADDIFAFKSYDQGKDLLHERFGLNF
ncbi:MAG: acyl carrier protein [Bacteroidaceae bacterium]|nr:acyl carrier protein [Bacteroidaceae bacterium]